MTGREVVVRRAWAVLVATGVVAASLAAAAGSAGAADVTAPGGGLVGGSEFDDGDGDGGAPLLGPAVDGELSVGDVFGDDGVYSWDDGGRVIGVRRAAAAADGVGGAVGGAPGQGGPDGGPGNSTGGEWFVTDTGQELLLHGGVIVVFEAGTARHRVAEVLARHGVSLGDAVPINGLEAGFTVSASPGESLVLAAGLAAEPEVAAASPNWNSPNTVDDLGAGGGGTGGGGGADAQGLSEAQGLSDAQRRYCTGYAPRAEWVFSDELHHCAWHFDAGTSFEATEQVWGWDEDPLVDINIGDAWDRTKGQGVHVAIADHHWNGGHEDLRDNVDAWRSANWGGQTSEPTYCYVVLFPYLNRVCRASSHGTLVAGVVGARDNDVGSRGVAPRAKLVNFNLLDDDSAARLIESWTGHSDVVGVSNHSYGVAGESYWLSRASSAWWTAVDGMLASGLGGLGTVFTMAAGNNRNPDYNAAGFSILDERKNHRGVMVVCAVGPDGTQSRYSNEGPNLWLCAPSTSGHGGLGIIAPEGSRGYRDNFGGTSAASPQVAGVAALVRSVNPQMTWRDVRLLLADTAQKNRSGDGSWLTGAANYSDPNSAYSYSHKYGFGVVDAEAAVDKAFAWPLLPAEKTSRTASTGAATALSNGKRRTELTLNVATGIDFVEHVSLELDMTTDRFREFNITLISPSGRESKISNYMGFCYPPSSDKCGLSGMFKFATTRHLGEDPNGAWKLRIDYGYVLLKRPEYASDIATLNSWTLNIHGHTKAEQVAVAPGVSFTVGTANATDATVTEGDSLKITATVHNTTLAQDLAVPIKFTRQSLGGYIDGSADFETASVTIPAGQTTAATTVTVVKDAIFEGDEVFTVRPGTALTGYHALGVTPTITVTDDGVAPVVTISGGAAVTEGSAVTFTVTAGTADPISATPATLPVIVKVTQAGDFGAATGTRTITVPMTMMTGGSAQFTVTTVDDDAYEPDGAVTATLQPDVGYTLGGARAASVSVEDDEAPPVVTISGGAAVTEGSAVTFTVTAIPATHTTAVPPTLPVIVKVTQAGDFGAATGTRTITVPMTMMTGGSAQFTVTTTDDHADETDGSVTATLKPDPSHTPSYTLGEARAASVSVEDDDPTPPAVSIFAPGGGVVEGSDAVFTVTAGTADPASATPATVTVTVEVTQASGDSGADLGTHTVTISLSKTAGGSAQLVVGSTDDEVDERYGIVMAAVQPGDGYVLGFASVAGVSFLDNDDPPPPVPVVSIAAAGDVVEGSDAVFTVSASPAPSAGLAVSVTVAAAGDFGAATGARTVTVPVSGSATLTVATVGDDVDEADGSVTATLDAPAAGAGYTVSPSAGSASVGVVDDDGAVSVPVVSIASSGDVTEGSDAVFTVSAVPKPSGPLPVKLSVAAAGDFGVAAGPRTVTVPVSGSTELRVSTVGDDVDESDGSVSVSVLAGSGYTVSGSAGSASVAVADDDDPRKGGYTVDQAVVARVRALAGQVQHGSAHVNRWQRVLVAFGELDSAGVSGGAMTAAQAQQMADAHSSPVWDQVVAELTALEASDDDDDDVDPPPITPVVSISGGGGITEGGSASFTITASPPPASPITVKVGVTQSGAFGASGAATVTVSGASTTYTVSTSDDSVDEPDGSVTATLKDGSGYTVSTANGAATVSVADDDDPPVITPVVSISAGGGITEGGSASFTITASPAPASPITVKVGVTQSGSFGASGSATVTVSGASTSYAVSTSDDGVDEPDGSVTATLQDGSGYTVSTTNGAATVSVADDDDPPPQTPELSITAGGGITEGGSASFTITASPALASPITVKVGVTQSGSFGASGSATVTVSGASTSYTVTTSDDGVDEPDGSVTATLKDGSGYTVSSAQGSATVGVADNDDPPPQEPGVSVSLSASVSSISEAGGEARITIALSRALEVGEWVQVPLEITGGDEGDHWTLEMRDEDNPAGGAWQTGYGAQPQVLFYSGGGTATLVLTAKPDADAADRALTVSLGTGPRAITSGGIDGGTETGTETVTVTITDND